MSRKGRGYDRFGGSEFQIVQGGGEGAQDLLSADRPVRTNEWGKEGEAYSRKDKRLAKGCASTPYDEKSCIISRRRITMKKLVCIVSIVLAVVMTGVRNSFAERLLSVGMARIDRQFRSRSCLYG